MADETTTTAEDSATEPGTEQTEAPASDAVPAEVKAALRKANKEAEKLRLRLKEYEDRDKTEAQKLAERAEAAEKAAAEAEARALRRDIALEHELSRDDAALLDAVTDEDAMRRLAGRLAQQATERAGHITGNGAYVPAEGKMPPALNSDQLEQSLRKALGVS